MNGFLHLGHAFSLSKAEFRARFEAIQGKNVLFPFAFHCTGMPIEAAAARLERELTSGKSREELLQDCTQYSILDQLGIPAEQINDFRDPQHWLTFFPPHAVSDLKKLGIYTDWRRSFITTPRNPFFDKFIQWQYHHLRE